MTSFLSVIPSEPRSTLKSSSSLAAVPPDFRPVDRELHDTSKRMVESMPDSRITFYSNLAGFEKKILKKETGYLTKATGRVGYLLLVPKKPVVWIDELKKQCFRIPMRISHTLFNQRTLFIATLNRGEGRLTIDDCWEWKSQLLTGKPFSKRWDYVKDFFSADFISDAKVQRGLRIEPATWYSLSSFSSLISTSTQEWIQWQPEEATQKRLRIELNVSKFIHEEEQSGVSEPVATPPLPPTQAHQFVNEPKNLTARAVAHPEMPDTYTLYTAEGHEKGTAAVQKYSLSKVLRNAVAEKEQKEVFVQIEWNSEFEKWEICGIARDATVASSSEKWVHPK